MIKLILVLGSLNFFVQQYVEATSEPYEPYEVKEKRWKAFNCHQAEELGPKLPEKYHSIYEHVRTVLCPNESVGNSQILKYYDDNLNKDEKIEIGIYSHGKDFYCNKVFDRSVVWGLNGVADGDPNLIDTPEFNEFRNFCGDSTKKEADIVPLAQHLSNIYSL